MGKLMDTLKFKMDDIWQQSFAPKYNALQDSEQRIVRIAAIFIPLIIFVFGIVLPILDKNTALQHEVATLAEKAQEANALADSLAKQPQQTKMLNGNILSQVDNIARQTHVRQFMTRLRPQPLANGKQKLQTQIKDAPYKDIASFIVALEKAGLSLSQVKIQKVKPGFVHMQAVIGQ